MKKLLPYILILIILAGVFSFGEKANAQENTDPLGTCLMETGPWETKTDKQCNDMDGNPFYGKKISWTAYPTGTDTTPGYCTKNGKVTTSIKIKCDGEWTTTAPNTGISGEVKNEGETDKNISEFDTIINEQLCAFAHPIRGTFWPGCFIQTAYALFYVIPSWLLWVAAYFFNVLISTTLYSELFYDSSFLPQAWGVTRDLSNIFFILALLYIAITIILDLRASEAKKMIVNVIIIALLINFSMFFTKVIIDSSNILALVFYNKLDASGRPYNKVTPGGTDKDVAGAMVAAFDPTKLLNKDFFDKAKKPVDIEKIVEENAGSNAGSAGAGGIESAKKILFPKVQPGILIGITLLTGTIMLFAAYCFVVVGLSFLGRLVELFILIIFSPFAFMSFTIPKLAGMEYIGWSDWFKRLIKVSFMAPIFMFFLYFIYLLTSTPGFFGGFIESNNKGFIESILLMVIPAVMILILLLKATDFAKKGSGKFGEVVIGGAKLAAGLAIGGAALGVAGIGRATLGATVKYVQNKGAREKDFGFKDLGTAVGKDWYKPWKYPSLAGKTITSAVKWVPAAAATGFHAIGIGQKMKTADEAYGHKTHATHILDAKMQSEFGHQYGKDAKYKDLTEHDQEIVKTEVDKDELAKFIYGKLFKDLEAPQAKEIKDKYDGTYVDPATGVAVGPQRAISNDHGKTIRVDSASATLAGGEKIKSDYFADKSKAPEAIGEFLQALRKGSYDIRNLPDMSAKTKGGPKFAVGTIATIAAGVRLGFKRIGGVEYGTSQRDVLKDIGNTVSEALKNVKININTSGGGGGHGGGDTHTKEVKSVGH